MSQNFEDMTFEDKIRWAKGRLILAIGEGKFSDEVYNIFIAISQDSYNRGRADGEKKR